MRDVESGSYSETWFLGSYKVIAKSIRKLQLQHVHFKSYGACCKVGVR